MRREETKIVKVVMKMIIELKRVRKKPKKEMIENGMRMVGLCDGI